MVKKFWTPSGEKDLTKKMDRVRQKYNDFVKEIAKTDNVLIEPIIHWTPKGAIPDTGFREIQPNEIPSETNIRG